MWFGTMWVPWPAVAVNIGHGGSNVIRPITFKGISDAISRLWERGSKGEYNSRRPFRTPSKLQNEDSNWVPTQDNTDQFSALSGSFTGKGEHEESET